MSDWDSIRDIIGATGIGSSIITGAWAWLRHRRARRDRLEDNQAKLEAAVRGDLWSEIANLRGAVSAAQSTLIDWQAKYVELLTQHKNTIEELVSVQQNFVKLGGLLTQAMASLSKIEEVERAIDAPDLDKAKSEIQTIRMQADSIREKALILYQT